MKVLTAPGISAICHSPVVNNDGKATQPVVAPRLKTLDEVKGKALMIHVGATICPIARSPLAAAASGLPAA